MRPREAMFGYQRDAVEAVRERRRAALLLPPGYGKTAITLTALDDLGVWPALVAAPAQVARRVWAAEAAEWAHLRGLVVTPIVGTPPRRLRQLRETSHVDVVSYENLLWLTEQVDLNARYRAVVFDELSKMKSPGSRRSIRMRALAGGTRIAVRLGLTGNPVGNHLLDLWGELAVIGGPEPLGRTFGGYRAEYFQPAAYSDGRPVSWVLQGMRQRADKEWEHTDRSRATEREIHRRVAPWCYALPPQPAAGIPPVRVTPTWIEMPDSARRATAELRRALVAHLDDGTEVEALSAGTRAAKLRQIAGGAVYRPADVSGAEWAPVHEGKLDALDALLDELQGDPVLVFYWYRHERDRILARLGRRGATVATPDSPRWVESWNAGEVEVLLAHPASAGWGLNLQAGGSHVAWYTLPDSHEMFTQGNGRLARPGQAAPFVAAHVLLCGDDVDGRVLSRLDRKRETEEDLVDSVRYGDLL